MATLLDLFNNRSANKPLLHIENGETIHDYVHDYNFYDALSDTYEFSHPNGQTYQELNTPVTQL